MVSKIENGSISPSLTTLQAISRGLAVPITWLVGRLEVERTAVFVKSGEPSEAAPFGTASRRQLGGKEIGAGLVVEPFVTTLARETDPFPTIRHQGTMFLYMLQGKVAYRHTDTLYRMTAGDSLFFDADTLHGPDELIELPVRYLSIITCRKGK